MKRIKLLLVFICTFFIYNASNAFNTKKNIKNATKVSNFCPAPILTSFFPSSGPENTVVYISGSNFNAAATVAFDGISTAFTIIDDNEIEAYVPSGIAASSTITIISSGGCTGISSTSFTLLDSACDTPDIYLSEIYDVNGGSTGLIELYNPTNTTLTFNGEYELQRFRDVGDATPSVTHILPGSVGPMQTYLVKIGGPTACGLTEDTEMGAGINANDQIKLFKNGALIDVVNAPNNVGYTVKRNPDAVAPNSTFVSSDWDTNTNESCADLGSHTADPIPDNTPTITQPTSQTICENGTATFTIAISGTETYTYQWKVLTSAGNWVNVTNDANYSGATTDTLMVSNTPASFDGNQYYCEVTSASCDLVTNVAQLEINSMTSPPATACWETATFNTTTCTWDITGTQDPMPTGLACWETATFNTTTCVWDVTGTQDPMPTGLACWETATFNTTTCVWDVTGTQDPMPTGLACWETATFNTTTCVWDVTGTQDPMPTGLACWETATFNTTTCVWDVTGTQDPMPTGLNCWDTATFNTTTCSWDVVTGTQDPMPTGLACWETATFNTTTCVWDITGTQDPMPTGLNCWDTATFNTTTCSWDVVTGTQDPMPTGLACWETATFNTTTCSWDISGTQDPMPTGLACWETATFNTTTCSWNITGTQDPMPTGLACWETATFNTTTCSWDITGTQDPMPTGLACWETTAFDTTTCSWIITGTQDPMPTGLACWETATFNTTTCTWEVTGTPIDFDLSLSNITILDNTITVSMTDTSINYLYTVDSSASQVNPTFTDLANGIHTLMVQDENGCVVKSIPFTIDGIQEINIPLFFTPNGDTFNDTWLITDTQNTIKQILIFDRYGKLLKEVSPAEKSWDGTYRGYNLESNDYWYLITLYTDEELKGHFTLKR
jgi:gliding motility-associated-like protein